LSVSVIETCAPPTAAPLGSETVPPTCATAVAWALIVEGKAKKIKTDMGKDNLANVDRDVGVTTNPPKNKTLPRLQDADST
jgi:hypothetical protein